MEGPTPVSALIHAATMVTAGVYLVARSMPLFRLTPTMLLVVATIGAFTAFMAAIIALTQTDLKRVLAYSTVSQLGYMFLALGSGGDRRAGAGGGDGGHLPSVHARLLQGAAVPRRRQRDARHGRRHRHAPLQRPAARHAANALDVPVRCAGARRLPALRRLLEQGRDPLRQLRGLAHHRLVLLPLPHGAGDGGADRVLHLPRLLPDLLGRETHPRRKRGITPTSRRR